MKEIDLFKKISEQVKLKIELNKFFHSFSPKMLQNSINSTYVHIKPSFFFYMKNFDLTGKKELGEGYSSRYNQSCTRVLVI